MDSFFGLHRTPPPPLSSLSTEGRNPASTTVDEADTEHICRIINTEDSQVPKAVEEVVPKIAEAIDAIVERVQLGGRLLYMGAGTSGRLGVLDAAELPPTYTADPMQYIALIAGGDRALRTAMTPNDTLIGIAASGRTPYVLGALECARMHGLLTIGLVCVRPSEVELEGNCHIVIDPVTGPEVITGSTRMKAGTATKMVLNMLSTGLQIKLGKTYGNLMIDVKATNAKLVDRARRIIRTVASEFPLPPTYSAILRDDEQLDAVVRRCEGSVKLALVVIISGWGIGLCKDALERRHGVLKAVLEDVRYETVVRVFNR
uniref:SIS domain-containing protein n=1 Tax=Moniliophthora roreri TaxID=221103 RepID=A0A0W0FWW0_MONRR